MCVGFWSLEHPEYALCVVESYIAICALRSLALSVRTASYAVIGMNSCLGPPRLPIGTRSDQSAPSITPKDPSSQVETSSPVGHGQGSIGVADSLCCV